MQNKDSCSQVGNYQFWISDSMKAMREEIASESIDLIVTDPPYGIDFQSGHRKNSKCEDTKKFDKIAGDATVSTDWLKDAHRILKVGGAIYVFTGTQVIGDWLNAIKACGFEYKSLIVWDKLWFGTGDLKGAYSPQYEFVIFASKGRHLLRGKRPKNIIRCRKLAPNRLEHPSQKPASLIAYLIEKSSDEGQLVLDPFLGIGTTLLASRLTNRRFIGYELDPQYKTGIEQRLIVQLDSPYVKTLLQNKVDASESKFGDATLSSARPDELKADNIAISADRPDSPPLEPNPEIYPPSHPTPPPEPMGEEDDDYEEDKIVTPLVAVPAVPSPPFVVTSANTEYTPVTSAVTNKTRAGFSLDL